MSEADALNLKKRKNIVMELLSTEETYVTQLKVIDYFSKLGKELGINEDERMKLFSNVGVLFKCHTKFLDQLKGIISAWNDMTSCLGPLFTEAAWIKFYKYYVNDFGAGQKLVEQLRVENSKFEAFLKAHEFTNSMLMLNIESLLVTPVQRIPRYVLLLQDLVKHTPKWHKDAEEIDIALAMIKALADYINKNRSDYENKIKLEDLDSRITDKPGDFMLSGGLNRRYIRESEVEMSVNKDKRKVWLFNDMILFGQENKKGQIKYKSSVKLFKMVIERGEKGTLHIVSEEDGQEAVAITVPEKENFDAWFEAVEGAINEVNDVLYGRVDYSLMDVSKEYYKITRERRKNDMTKLIQKFAEQERVFAASLDEAQTTFFKSIRKGPDRDPPLLPRATADTLSKSFLAVCDAHKAFVDALNERETELDAKTTIADILRDHENLFDLIMSHAESAGSRKAALDEAMGHPPFEKWLGKKEDKSGLVLKDVMEGPSKRLNYYYRSLTNVLQTADSNDEYFEFLHASVNKLSKLNERVSKLKDNAKVIKKL